MFNALSGRQVTREEIISLDITPNSEDQLIEKCILSDLGKNLQIFGLKVFKGAS